MRAGPRGVAHDEDGNLIEDGDFEYVWDAENRLTGVTPVNPGYRQRRLEFEYDYMSRRIRKLVFGWNSTTEDWEVDPEVDLRFVYDGWNLVQEIDGLVTAGSSVTDVAREYTWGLDLSGQSGNVAPANGRLSGIHGAGGIGGLLGTHWTLNTTSTSDDTAYIYFYDANGNVGQMIDVVSGTNYGTIAAKYEYYPFGGLLVADGVAAEANPFRFSTKYRDNETGCYYYGYRYLRTKHGRWLNRDPIGESGGLNLTLLLYNDPVNGFDIHGLYGPETHYWATREMALRLGMPPCIAEAIAEADQGLDENGQDAVTLSLAILEMRKNPWVKLTTPADWDHLHVLEEGYRKHMPGAGPPWGPIPQGHVINAHKNNKDVTAYLADAMMTCDLRKFGEALHSLQDSYSHEGKPHLSGHSKQSFDSDGPGSQPEIPWVPGRAPFRPSSTGFDDHGPDDPYNNKKRWQMAISMTGVAIDLFMKACPCLDCPKHVPVTRPLKDKPIALFRHYWPRTPIRTSSP